MFDELNEIINFINVENFKNVLDIGVKKLLGACLHASKTTSTIADSSFTLTIFSRGLRESSPGK